MNGKYALALILALQVSMSLCELPVPEKELVEKYEGMKNLFYKRLLNAFGKIQASVAPVVAKIGEGEQGMIAKGYIEDLQSNPQFQSAVKIATGFAQEAAPLVETARMAGLGLYGQYLRPHVGTYLDQAINNIKVHLDKFLPAE